MEFEVIARENVGLDKIIARGMCAMGFEMIARENVGLGKIIAGGCVR